MKINYITNNFNIYKNTLLILANLKIKMEKGDWGLGIGDWGLGPNTQSPIPNPPIPNPQSPIPNPHFSFIFKYFTIY